MTSARVWGAPNRTMAMSPLSIALVTYVALAAALGARGANEGQQADPDAECHLTMRTSSREINFWHCPSEELEDRVRHQVEEALQQPALRGGATMQAVSVLYPEIGPSTGESLVEAVLPSAVGDAEQCQVTAGSAAALSTKTIVAGASKLNPSKHLMFITPPKAASDGATTVPVVLTCPCYNAEATSPCNTEVVAVHSTGSHAELSVPSKVFHRQTLTGEQQLVEIMLGEFSYVEEAEIRVTKALMQEDNQITVCGSSLASMLDSFSMRMVLDSSGIGEELVNCTATVEKPRDCLGDSVTCELPSTRGGPSVATEARSNTARLSVSLNGLSYTNVAVVFEDAEGSSAENDGSSSLWAWLSLLPIAAVGLAGYAALAHRQLSHPHS